MLGQVTDNSNPQSVGVRGSVDNGAGIGVRGDNASPGGIGVYGEGQKNGVRGVQIGSNTAAFAGYFSATNGTALGAFAGNNFALFGFGNSLYGITGGSNSSIGIRATSNSGIGLFVNSDTSTGARINTSSGQIGLRVTNFDPDPGDFSIITDGSVHVNGSISCTGSCVQAQALTTDQGERLFYADASPSAIIADQGTAS